MARQPKDVQTVIVSKDRAKSRKAAAAIVKKVTGRKAYTIRETENAYHFRQFPPGQCIENSYASKEIDDGVTIVICTRRT